MAIELFRTVRESRAPLDTVIFNAAVQSCGAGGLWREALACFEEIQAERWKSMSFTTKSVIFHRFFLVFPLFFSNFHCFSSFPSFFFDFSWF